MRYKQFCGLVVFLVLLCAGCGVGTLVSSPSPRPGDATGEGSKSVLGCEMHPPGTASNRASADGGCTGQQVMARACHLSAGDVDEQLGYTAAGDSATLTTFGHSGLPHSTMQSPINGGTIIINCVGQTAYPSRTIEKDLWDELTQPGDPGRLPEWLQVA
jgi:hypothetical protein